MLIVVRAVNLSSSYPDVVWVAVSNILIRQEEISKFIFISLYSKSKEVNK